VCFYAFAIIAKFTKFDIGCEIMGDKEVFEMWLLGGRYEFIKGFYLDIGISGNFMEEDKVTGTIGLHYEF